MYVGMFRIASHYIDFNTIEPGQNPVFITQSLLIVKTLRQQRDVKVSPSIFKHNSYNLA